MGFGGPGFGGPPGRKFHRFARLLGCSRLVVARPPFPPPGMMGPPGAPPFPPNGQMPPPGMGPPGMPPPGQQTFVVERLCLHADYSHSKVCHRSRQTVLSAEGRLSLLTEPQVCSTAHRTGHSHRKVLN